jgi:hypothetical protein
MSTQNRNVPFSSKVEMSPFLPTARRRVLESNRPRGVAPKRMPKAEATTGLAPKKASAQNPLKGVIHKASSEGFVFDFLSDLSWVESRRSGGLGQ